jgi:hypothetical protein
MVRGYGMYVMIVVKNGSWKCDGSVEVKNCGRYLLTRYRLLNSEVDNRNVD